MTRPTPRTINTRIQNASAKGRALLQRWDRIGLGIRCAYNPAQAGVIRLWLTLGQQLVLHQALSDLQMQQRALTLLLRTAADEALPWFWRSVCLEHCAAPQARLRSTTPAARLAMRIASGMATPAAIISPSVAMTVSPAPDTS